MNKKSLENLVNPYLKPKSEIEILQDEKTQLQLICSNIEQLKTIIRKITLSLDINRMSSPMGFYLYQIVESYPKDFSEHELWLIKTHQYKSIKDIENELDDWNKLLDFF